MSRRIDDKVQGLDCSEEVAILRREVGGKPGVIDLEFDVINARMTVEFEPAAISTDEIVEAVRAAGMLATPWELRKTGAHESFWSRYGRLSITTYERGTDESGTAHGPLPLPGLHEKPVEDFKHAKEAAVLLGEQIKLGRKQKRWTENELTERAGISRATLQKIAKGDMSCAIGLVFEVATLVNIPLSEQDLYPLSR